MNSLPLSEWTPSRGTATQPDVDQRAEHVRSPLSRHGAVLGPAGRHVGHRQGVAELSVGVAASWPTRSISRTRGSSRPIGPGPQRDRDFSSDPGLVATCPQVQRARSAASRRSIVAGDIATAARRAASSMSSSPCRRSAGTSPATPARGVSRRAVQHRPAQPQRVDHLGAVAQTGAPGPPRRPRAPAAACRNAFRAWSRCHPVSRAQRVQDRRLLRPGRLPPIYRLNSPDPSPHRQSRLHPRTIRPRTNSHESTNRPRRASWMSQRGDLALARVVV